MKFLCPVGSKNYMLKETETNYPNWFLSFFANNYDNYLSQLVEDIYPN